MRAHLRIYAWIFLLDVAYQVLGGPPQITDTCLKANKQCEINTDCIHRLAVLQSACVTNTCQPQCREAALNLYQNREGRALMRTDASCLPGRYELEKCGFLPSKSPKHCSFAKLLCETDLQCNSKWEVFVSECESETNEGRCSDKCQRHLSTTLATQNGAEFANCTCTDKEDDRCVQLREVTLRTCLQAPSDGRGDSRPLPRPGSHPTYPSHSPEEAGEASKDGSHSAPASAPRSLSLPIGAFVLSLLSLLFARCCLFDSRI